MRTRKDDVVPPEPLLHADDEDELPTRIYLDDAPAFPFCLVRRRVYKAKAPKLPRLEDDELPTRVLLK
jgi:hypothetical protein